MFVRKKCNNEAVEAKIHNQHFMISFEYIQQQ